MSSEISTRSPARLYKNPNAVLSFFFLFRWSYGVVLWEIATVGNKIKIANTFTQYTLNFSFIPPPL